MPGEDETTRLDVALVQGFSFACRPDCGLCCFASPRISPGEQHALRVVAPQATFVGRGRDRYLSARPDGGACQFLANLRCGVHAQRPAPCREFPITVHLGERLQASVVLSCPGLDLRRLTDSRSAA
ncbi:MAG TPA: YkgJ family cysteine cluster protein, partial [Thermoplasmata archaeon]|nr:YkgJ family cysteine cluster protein [Thermoplasmata archaeon]